MLRTQDLWMANVEDPGPLDSQCWGPGPLDANIEDPVPPDGRCWGLGTLDGHECGICYNHPKWSSIEWVMSKTIKLIINPLMFICFGWSRACFEAHRYRFLYPDLDPDQKPTQNPWVYPYPCNTLVVMMRCSINQLRIYKINPQTNKQSQR